MKGLRGDIMNLFGQLFESKFSRKNLVLLPVVLLVTLAALIAYAQVLMTPAMQTQMNQAIAGLISNADEVEQIAIPTYQIAEITESGEWGSVNSIVSDAKSDLALYFLTVEQQLEANYPGGFNAWKNTGNPPNSVYYQAVIDAYNAYGDTMPFFNSNTEDMITNRQILMLCSSGTLLMMAGTAVFALTPPVNVPVVAIGMGLI